MSPESKAPDEHFEELLARHAKVVGSAIRRVCKGRHAGLAEDAEQELRLALWKRMRGGKRIEHPVSYLYKAALTTALAVLRRQRPQEIDVPVEAEEPAAGRPSRSPRGLLPAEESRLLAQLLVRLPEEQSRALRAYLAGFNHGEIARLYGWTDSVARHRIYRGMDALRAAMDEEGDDVTDHERDALLQRARRAYRDLQREGTPREAPTDEELADLVLGNLEGEERARVADAVVASPDLAARVRELMEVHELASAELELPAPARDTPPPAARRFRPLLAAAAVLVAVAGLAFWTLRPEGPSPDPLRGDPAGTPLAVAPDENAILAVAPAELRWTEVPGASAYRAVLYDFESSILWESAETPATSVELPSDVRASLTPGADYFWRVVYRVGIDERRTPLRRFRVEP